MAEIVSEMEKLPNLFRNDTLDDEEAREHGQKATPKRAAEWLAGRIALKRSIRRVMATTDTGTISEKSIRIIQDEQGKPIGELSGRPGLEMNSISLSHSNGLAMAAAAVPGRLKDWA